MTATNNRTATADTTATAAPANDSGTRLDGTAGAVWDALTANPGGTAATIAGAAGISRKDAAKVLTALGADGRAVRSAGGKGKADTWTAAMDATTETDDTTGDPDDTDTDMPDAPADAAAAPAAPALNVEDAMRILAEEEVRRATAEAELQQALAEEEARRAKAVADLQRARTAEDTRRALADLLAAATATYAAVASDDTDAVAAGLESIYTATNNVRRATKAAPVRTATAKGNGTAARADRAAPRPLRPEVAAHLAAHPDTDFTPGEIARVLDRSSGAVANALDTLAKNGEAVLTSERPHRYQATTNPTGTPAPTATNTASDTDEAA